MGYYNDKDGHTYFKLEDEGWIAYPTFSDGSLDLEGCIHCDELDPGVSEEDEEQIRKFIASIEGR